MLAKRVSSGTACLSACFVRLDDILVGRVKEFSVVYLFGRGVWVNVPWRVECGSTGTGLPLSCLVEGNVVYLNTCKVCNVLQAKAITS